MQMLFAVLSSPQPARARCRVSPRVSSSLICYLQASLPLSSFVPWVALLYSDFRDRKQSANPLLRPEARRIVSGRSEEYVNFLSTVKFRPHCEQVAGIVTIHSKLITECSGVPRSSGHVRCRPDVHHYRLSRVTWTRSVVVGPEHLGSARDRRDTMA